MEAIVPGFEEFYSSEARALAPEIENIIERALAAGATPPLDFVGAGMTAAVFCDAKGKGYKVARNERTYSMLSEEAEWLYVANQIPVVQDHVARFGRYHDKLGVIERECVAGKRAGWKDSRRVHDMMDFFKQAMMPYGWSAPERKEDSFIITRDRGLVLVDASMPHRVGRNLVQYTLDILNGKRRRGPYETNEDLAFSIRMESGSTIPPEVADRVLSKLNA